MGAESRRSEAAPVEGEATVGGGRAAEHLTDLGNAKRLVRQHGPDMRFSRATGWLVWTGLRWMKDDTGEAMRRAKATILSLFQEAPALEPAERAALVEHAVRSERRERLVATLGLAETEPEVIVTPDALDADPWLLSVLNGALNLRTGELRPHRREDLITKMAPVAYDPAAVCPTWHGFLGYIIPDEAQRRFIQKLAGYTLTGDAREQALFIFYGTGANGKSTLVETWRDLLGDYAQPIRAETLLVKRGDAIPNDLAALRGARFVYAVEPEGGRRLAEALIKAVTGGDTVTARFLYREHFSFRPTFKVVLVTNHKPLITGTDHAIWRRMRLCEFPVTIPEPAQDKALRERLRAELPGILRWAVEGCLLWQAEGLNPPEAVRAATRCYRAEMDAVGAFIAGRCAVAKDLIAPVGRLYEAYRQFCGEAGGEPVSLRAFGLLLTERGFLPDRTGEQRLRRGIALLATTGNGSGTHPTEPEVEVTAWR